MQIQSNQNVNFGMTQKEAYNFLRRAMESAPKAGKFKDLMATHAVQGDWNAVIHDSAALNRATGKISAHIQDAIEDYGIFLQVADSFESHYSSDRNLPKILGTLMFDQKSKNVGFSLFVNELKSLLTDEDLRTEAIQKFLGAVKSIMGAE